MGHRRDLIAVAVLLDRVRAWLLTEIDEHLREITPSFLLLLRLPRFGKPATGNDSERLEAIWVSDQPTGLIVMRFARKTSYPAMFRGSSRPLLGAQASKPKHGCPSVIKGTREARPSRVVMQPEGALPFQVPPKRRTSGGAVVVVRGWESQPHGEGRQDVSFWKTEGFTNREGSR